jgi:hypothetical protein
MPNPTNGQLVLNWGGNTPTAPVSVHISNRLGQLVYTQHFLPMSSSSSLDFSKEAAPGVYSISVLTKEQAVLYKGTFMKL